MNEKENNSRDVKIEKGYKPITGPSSQTPPNTGTNVQSPNKGNTQ